MVMLSLTCHSCHQAFPSGVSLDVKGDRRRPIDGVVYECPSCRTRDTYLTSEQHRMGPGEVPVARSSDASRWSAHGSLPVPLSLLPLLPGTRAGWEEEPPSRLGVKFWGALAGGVAAGALGLLMVLAVVHGVQRGEVGLLPW